MIYTHWLFYISAYSFGVSVILSSAFIVPTVFFFLDFIYFQKDLVVAFFQELTYYSCIYGKMNEDNYKESFVCQKFTTSLLAFFLVLV